MKPDGLPALEIRLGGAPVPPEVLGALERLRVHQALSVPSQCELVLADPRGHLAREGVPPGTSLEVRAGPSEVPLFEGDVTAVELSHGPRRDFRLRVRGYDLLHRLRERRPVRAHAGVSALDLARQLGGELGLSVEASATAPAWRHRLQYRQSDLELLADLAARSGLYLALRGRTLHLASLEGLDAPLPLAYGETLLEADVELNAGGACRTVAGTGWSARDAAGHAAVTGRPRSGRAVRASVEESADERTVADVSAEEDAHVEGQAQAILDASAAREVVLRGVAKGDPRLRPLARVELRGLSPLVTGTHVLTEVTHTIEAGRGFLSELSSAPPPAPPRPRAAGATLGVVSEVDGGTGRVRVRLPAFGGLETDWLKVAAPGAGNEKGLAMVPDRDDAVLVLYPHEDPAEGVVVGGLHGASGPPDTVVDGGRVVRFALRGRCGHRVVLDDTRRVLRVEDATGSFLQLDPDGVQLHAKRPLTIDAPGQPIVIRGSAVDFRRE